MATPFALKASMVTGGIATVSGLGSVAYISTWITIGDKLQKDNFTLINSDEDYKIVLFNNKESSFLKTVISVTSIDYSQNVSNIKQWCGEKIKEWFASDKDKLFQNVKSWCTVPTIKLLGDKLGRNLHKAETWGAKFTEIVGKSEVLFLAALNAGVATSNHLNKSSPNGGDKLKEWCESALKLKVYETDPHKTEDNIKAWCLIK